MSSSFKTIFYLRAFLVGLFLFDIGVLMGDLQVQAREWTVLTNADALSEVDHQKLATLPSEILNEKKRLKIISNAFKVCRKDSPNDVVIEANPAVKAHPSRKFKGLPVLIFTKVVCISKDLTTSPEEISGIELLLSIFPDNSSTQEAGNRDDTPHNGKKLITLNDLNTDNFSVIGKFLSGRDIIYLSMVNRKLKSKVSKIIKKMRFTINPPASLKLKEGEFETKLKDLFAGPLALAQDVKICKYNDNDPFSLNLLTKFVKRLSIIYNKSEFTLEAMNPDNFEGLKELGAYAWHENSIPLNYYLKFPNLVGLGTFECPVYLSVEDFNSLPKLAGNRITSLSIGRIRNTKEELINILNGLPFLKKLNFSYGSNNIGLDVYDINSLHSKLSLESFKIQGNNSSGIYFVSVQSMNNFIEKFINIKTFWADSSATLITGINFSLWNKLERLGITTSDSNEFWQNILPHMPQLKVLSINISNEKENSFKALGLLKNLEKLQIRGNLGRKDLVKIGNSKSKITELSVIASCFTDNGLLNVDFLELVKLHELRILYSTTRPNHFQECKKILSNMSNGRVLLVNYTPDFFEDELEY